MSCLVLTAEATRQIGHTLENIISQYIYSNTLTIPWYAVDESGILEVFKDCRNRSGDYDGEMISAELYRLNVKAYNGRYKETGGEDLPPEQTGFPRLRKVYSLVKIPEYGENREIPQEWHFHLCRLLDCWLYQTCEDATDKHEKRQALRKFSDALKVAVVQHSDEYNNFRWGC